MAGYIDRNKRGELKIYGSLDDLTTELVEYISHLSEKSVKERGSFAIAVSGRTLPALLGKLAASPYIWTVDWSKWRVFFADERAVAKNHTDSNYKLFKEGFLSKVPLASGHVCSINDSVSVEAAASEYEFAMRQHVRSRTVDACVTSDCPRFDLILLEMGSDGHVASLFPSHAALGVRNDWVTYIADSPRPPPERITFTLPVINSASHVAIVAIGEDKADALSFAVSQASTDSVDGDSLDACFSPASMVGPSDGSLVWFLDSSAASRLDSALI